MQDSNKSYGIAIDVSELATGTDGELLTWDASGNATTVAVGTAGQVLTSNGAGSAPTFQAAGGGNWLLVEQVSLGAAAGTIGNTTALDINTDGYYRIILNLTKDSTVGSNSLSVQINSDTTAANYYTQFEEMSASTDTKNRINSNRVADNLTADSNNIIDVLVVRTQGGYGFIQSFCHTELDSTTNLMTTSSTHTKSTVTNITDVDFALSGNQFVTGSTMSIYKLTTS